MYNRHSSTDNRFFFLQIVKDFKNIFLVNFEQNHILWRKGLLKILFIIHKKVEKKKFLWIDLSSDYPFLLNFIEKSRQIQLNVLNTILFYLLHLNVNTPLGTIFSNLVNLKKKLFLTLS